MENDVIQNKWQDIKRQIRDKWGKLTYSEIDALKNNLDGLVAKLQTAYGYARERAEREYHDFRVALFPLPRPAITLTGPLQVRIGGRMAQLAPARRTK